jgi:hypothetical protein
LPLASGGPLEPKVFATDVADVGDDVAISVVVEFVQIPPLPVVRPDDVPVGDRLEVGRPKVVPLTAIGVVFIAVGGVDVTGVIDDVDIGRVTDVPAGSDEDSVDIGDVVVSDDVTVVSADDGIDVIVVVTAVPEDVSNDVIIVDVIAVGSEVVVDSVESDVRGSDVSISDELVAAAVVSGHQVVELSHGPL